MTSKIFYNYYVHSSAVSLQNKDISLVLEIPTAHSFSNRIKCDFKTIQV